jgi:hypothetical protein
MRHFFLLILLVLFLVAPLAPDAWSDDISASTMVTMDITGMT